MLALDATLVLVVVLLLVVDSPGEDDDEDEDDDERSRFMDRLLDGPLRSLVPATPGCVSSVAYGFGLLRPSATSLSKSALSSFTLAGSRSCKLFCSARSCSS